MWLFIMLLFHVTGISNLTPNEDKAFRLIWGTVTLIMTGLIMYWLDRRRTGRKLNIGKDEVVVVCNSRKTLSISFQSLLSLKTWILYTRMSTSEKKDDKGC